MHCILILFCHYFCSNPQMEFCFVNLIQCCMMRSSLNRRWELWRWNLFKWLFKLVDLIRLIMKLITLDVHLYHLSLYTSKIRYHPMGIAHSRWYPAAHLFLGFVTGSSPMYAALQVVPLPQTGSLLPKPFGL